MDKAIQYIKENNILSLKEYLTTFNINTLDKNNNNLLHHSIYYHRYEITYYLISAGINLNIMNNFELTPLSLAVKLDLLNIVIALIENNANPYIYNKNLEDSIYLAYLYGRGNIIEYFQGHFSYNYKKCNKFKENLLFALIKSHNLNLVKKYINIENISSCDLFNNTLLMTSVRIDDYNITNYLLSISNYNINFTNINLEQAITLAINNKNKRIIKLLLNNLAFTYFKNRDYRDDIKALDDLLLSYDKTDIYRFNYPLIFYLIEDDYNMFIHKLNYKNIYIKDNYNKNVIDYLYMFKFNYKHNKYYKVLSSYLNKRI